MRKSIFRLILAAVLLFLAGRTRILVFAEENGSSEQEETFIISESMSEEEAMEVIRSQTRIDGDVVSIDTITESHVAERPGGYVPAVRTRSRSFRPADVPLAEGTFCRFIDRIVLHAYVQGMYEKLEEAADNDGYADWLIDPTLGEINSSNSSWCITISSVSGSVQSQDEFETLYEENRLIWNAYGRAVYEAFYRDHPEIFWLSGVILTGTESSYSNETGEYSLSFYLTLRTETGSTDVRRKAYQNVSSIQSDIGVRDNAVAQILSGASGTVIQKLLYFNDWLAEYNQYSTLYERTGTVKENSYQCLSALTGSTGDDGPVCEGYAKAMKVLCDASGIPCAISTSEDHMWNIVQVDNKWYALDSTWNDQGTASSVHLQFLAGKETICINGSDYASSHVVDNTVTVNGLNMYNEPPIEQEGYTLTDADIPGECPEEIPVTEIDPGQISITNAQITVEPRSVIYNDGQPFTPSVTVVAPRRISSVRKETVTCVCGSITDSFESWKQHRRDSSILRDHSSAEAVAQTTYDTLPGTLTLDVDYTVSYENNTEVGQGRVIIEGMGDYTGRAVRTFDIESKPVGWKKIDGKWYYYEQDGTMVTGWKKIQGCWRFFDEDGVMQIGWHYENGIWYYLDSAGRMQTGWVKVDEVWYNFTSTGRMRVGWAKLDGYWYYFAPSGKMQTGWVKIDDVWYFFAGSGEMAASEWRDGWWLSANGSWTYPYKGSWKQDSKGWWFGDTSRWYARNTTIRINGKEYTFDAAGYWIGD